MVVSGKNVDLVCTSEKQVTKLNNTFQNKLGKTKKKINEKQQYLYTRPVFDKIDLSFLRQETFQHYIFSKHK